VGIYLGQLARGHLQVAYKGPHTTVPQSNHPQRFGSSHTDPLGDPSSVCHNTGPSPVPQLPHLLHHTGRVEEPPGLTAGLVPRDRLQERPLEHSLREHLGTPRGGPADMPVQVHVRVLLLTFVDAPWDSSPALQLWMPPGTPHGMQLGTLAFGGTGMAG
jgi:hypothetical protein